MAEARRAGSGSAFVAPSGFCRARRAGDRVPVAGTAPIRPDGVVGSVHGETFAARPPVAAMVVAALLDPRWRVEVEVDVLVA